MNNFKCVLKCFYVLLSFIFLYIDIFLFRFYLFIFSAGSVLFSIYFQLVILVLQLNINKILHMFNIVLFQVLYIDQAFLSDMLHNSLFRLLFCPDLTIMFFCRSSSQFYQTSTIRPKYC